MSSSTNPPGSQSDLPPALQALLSSPEFVNAVRTIVRNERHLETEADPDRSNKRAKPRDIELTARISLEPPVMADLGDRMRYISFFTSSFISNTTPLGRLGLYNRPRSLGPPAPKPEWNQLT